MAVYTFTDTKYEIYKAENNPTDRYGNSVNVYFARKMVAADTDNKIITWRISVYRTGDSVGLSNCGEVKILGMGSSEYTITTPRAYLKSSTTLPDGSTSSEKVYYYAQDVDIEIPLDDIWVSYPLFFFSGYIYLYRYSSATSISQTDYVPTIFSGIPLSDATGNPLIHSVDSSRLWKEGKLDVTFYRHYGECTGSYLDIRWGAYRESAYWIYDYLGYYQLDTTGIGAGELATVSLTIPEEDRATLILGAVNNGVDTLSMDYVVEGNTNADEASLWNKYLWYRQGFYEETLIIETEPPIVTVTVKDIDATSVAATGDSNVLVKYISDVVYTMTCEAPVGTNITSYKASDGATAYENSYTNMWEDTEVNKFYFYAYNDRGGYTALTVEKEMVDYIKLTTNITSTVPTGEGNSTITITGNYFNGSFGAKTNTLAVYYRYKLTSSSVEWGEWIPIDFTYDEEKKRYTCTADITGLDYTKGYYFQSRAVDLMLDIQSAKAEVRSLPVFDWSDDDFNFNVPVYYTNPTTGNKKLIAGGDSEYDSDTSTSNELELTIGTDTNTYNYTVTEGKAYLLGNQLVVNLTLTSNHSIDFSQLSNTLTVTHAGRIKEILGYTQMCNIRTNEQSSYFRTLGTVPLSFTENKFTFKLGMYGDTSSASFYTSSKDLTYNMITATYVFPVLTE